MLKMVHLKLSGEMFENLDLNLSKFFFLIGSVIPDLNCAFPTHTYNNTIERTKRRIKNGVITKSKIIRSFNFGIASHYISDYFCASHNLIKNNYRHAIYERIMKAKLNNEEMLLSSLKSDFKNFISENKIETVEDFFEFLKDMHDKYLAEIDVNTNKEWYKSEENIRKDIEYAIYTFLGIGKIAFV